MPSRFTLVPFWVHSAAPRSPRGGSPLAASFPSPFWGSSPLFGRSRGTSSEVCQLRSIGVSTCCASSNSPITCCSVEGSMSRLRLTAISQTVGRFRGPWLHCTTGACGTAHTARNNLGREGQGTNVGREDSTPMTRVPLRLRMGVVASQYCGTPDGKSRHGAVGANISACMVFHPCMARGSMRQPLRGGWQEGRVWVQGVSGAAAHWRGILGFLRVPCDRGQRNTGLARV